jgi:hypothetical protein
MTYDQEKAWFVSNGGTESELHTFGGYEEVVLSARGAQRRASMSVPLREEQRREGEMLRFMLACADLRSFLTRR